MSTPTQDTTPGRQALEVMQSIRKEIIFKQPTGQALRRRHNRDNDTKERILDEDTYVEQIGDIIERDFFPDLERLKAQNEYLEAETRNDVIKMRELYKKYSGSRPPTHRMPSPATFETPVHKPHEPVDESTTVAKEPGGDNKLSLDQFLNSHTSQDNHSFGEIIVEAERKHRDKYSYLYSEELASDREKSAQLALPSIESQAALPEKKLNVDTWTYKNHNYIMYTPDGVALTREQMIEMNKRRQEVMHSNTRLTSNPFNDNRSKETITELAKTQAKILDGKIGPDGKELTQGSPKIAGFSFVPPPSPQPGLADTPLMTWGEIEGTPFRLDGSDTPLPPRSHGPSFKMAAVPAREKLALALAEQAGEKRALDKKQKAMAAARRQFGMTPSPRGDRRLATMSPAARRLATNARMGSNWGGATPSPARSIGAGRSGKVGVARTPTPKSLGIRRGDDGLTDDLLKIKVPTRQKASDFF